MSQRKKRLLSRIFRGVVNFNRRLGERGEVALDDLMPDDTDTDDPEGDPGTGQPPEGSQVNPEEGEGTPAQEPPEGQTGEGEGEGTGENYYTPEEMRQLDPELIDTSRIPPEMVPFYKSMQSGYTRKIQTETDRLRTAYSQPQPGAGRKPSTIFEAYDQDSAGTLNYINGKMETALNSGDMVEHARLSNLKSELILHGQRRVEETGRMNMVAGQVERTIRTAVPDFDAKEPKLTEFANKELGLSMDAIRFLSNPGQVGPLAAEITIALNRVYDMVNAGKTLPGKVNNQPTPRVEIPGRPAPGTSKQANVQALLKKAQDSGTDEDWDKYFLALEG